MFTSPNQKKLFISPHLDDAVLSCGALIDALVENHNNVTVATLFGGKKDNILYSKLAKNLHESWNIKQASRIAEIRQKEDLQALDLLGAKAIHFDMLDCIYRTDSKGYLLYDYDNFDCILSYKISPRDITVFKLTSIFKKCLTLSDYSTIYAPLGAGGHIDHIQSRYLGEFLFNMGKNVIFYSDFYAIDKKELTKSFLLSNLNFTKFHIKLKEKNINAHISAVQKYTSQVHQLEKYYRIKFNTYCYKLATHQNPKNGYFIQLWKPFYD